MKRKINVGLIGAGRFGKMYAEFISQRIPRASLAAIADIVPERARSCAEELSVPRWYDNHHDLNYDTDIDAVVIAATTLNHKEIIVDAAGSRKPVFCEKPITLSLEEAREARDAVQKAGTFFQMGLHRRFDKGFAAAKQKIEGGVIGEPVVFRGSSRDPFIPSLDYLDPGKSGGQILDMAIHDIDIARWYMGDIETVYAVGCALAYPELKDIGDTDNAVMVLTFESGALGEIDISRNGVYGYDIRAEVLGTKGTLKAGYLRDTPLLVLTAEGVTHDAVPYFPERFADAYVAQLDNFVSNAAEGREPPITLEDGIKALQVAVAATRSQKSGTIMNTGDF